MTRLEVAFLLIGFSVGLMFSIAATLEIPSSLYRRVHRRLRLGQGDARIPLLNTSGGFVPPSLSP